MTNDSFVEELETLPMVLIFSVNDAMSFSAKLAAEGTK